jgi:hypothetical protein
VAIFAIFSNQKNETVKSSYKPRIRLYEQYIGYDDGSAQFGEIGCPNGEFWTYKKGEVEQIKDYYQTYELSSSQYRLAPVILHAEVDTDMPNDDYIRVTDLTVEVLSFEPLKNVPPKLIVLSTVCADADPGHADYCFFVKLGGDKSVYSVLKPNYRNPNPPQYVIRQPQPTAFRLLISGIEPGWYEVKVQLAYRYRTEIGTTQLSSSLKFYMPSPDQHSWYHLNCNTNDCKVVQLNDEQIDDIVYVLDQYSVTGFPPDLNRAEKYWKYQCD